MVDAYPTAGMLFTFQPIAFENSVQKECELASQAEPGIAYDWTVQDSSSTSSKK
jgi:hypothetical protein